MSDRTRKLVALRARTDHDLLVLVNRELDRGFAHVDVATSRNSRFFAEAEKAFATAEALLPRISGLTGDERVKVEGRLKALRLRMDQVPWYLASFAS